MVKKIALVRALREAFVEDLGGMIDEDEAWNENLPPRKSNKTTIRQDDVFEDAEIEPTEVNLDDL